MSKVITIAYISRNTKKTTSVQKEDYPKGYYLRDPINYELATGKVTSINGYCYRNNDDVLGDNFGYFNGYPADDEIMYDLSQMKRADSNIVWDAIDAIEPHVLGTAE